jgi:hypothetical protein
MLNEHEFLGFLDFEILAVFLFSYCMIAWLLPPFGRKPGPRLETKTLKPVSLEKSVGRGVSYGRRNGDEVPIA